MSSATTLSQRAVRPASGNEVPSRFAAGDAGFPASARVWLILVGFLAVVQLFITYVGAGLERDPRAALFGWPMIAVFGVAGLVGIWFSHRTGFPSAWGNGEISNRNRILVPALIGTAFGL